MLSFIFGNKKDHTKFTNVAVQGELVYVKFEITVTMHAYKVSCNLKNQLCPSLSLPVTKILENHCLPRVCHFCRVVWIQRCEAERTMQTVKQMWKKSGDMCMALVSYRATPLPWCNLRPVELLMGRHI